MPENNAKKWAVIAAVLTLIGAAMAVGGLTVGEGDQYGVFMIGLILALTFLICFFVFRAQARRLDRMFKREELLAHWQFDLTEKQKRIQEEFETKKKGNRILLLIVVAFFVMIAGLFVIFGFDDLEEAALFILIIVSVLVVISAAAFLAPILTYRKMQASSPEVFVGPYGAWVMGEFMMWKAAMTRPRQVLFEASPVGARIIVHFEILQRYGWQKHTCRIPVPAGSELQARQVASQIAGINQVDFDPGDWQPIPGD